MNVNRQVLLVERPEGVPSADCFRLVESPLPELAEGQFLVKIDYYRYPEGQRQMAQWLREGRIRYRETIVEGLEHAPDAFIGLFRGDNIGKILVRLA